MWMRLPRRFGSHNAVALYLHWLRMEREGGSIWLFQSGKLFARFLIANRRRGSHGRSAQIAYSQ
jgi:hypothetical protein